VGLEYGKGDVKPRPASQVYDNKYGDCKDKSILLVTMLREAGIEAYPVGVSTLFNGQAWKEIPRIDALNHIITLCIINDERIWLDPTVETVSFGDIHGGILDRNALVILDDGYEFIRIPIEPPEKNMEQEIMTVHVAHDSSAKVFTTITTKGINAIYRRAFFKDLGPLYRKQNLEATVKGRTSDGMLLDYAVSDPEDLNHPHTVELVYTAPDYIHWEVNTGFIEASILSANKAAITDDIRLYPVFLGNTSVGDLTVQINLPEEITIVSLPSAITLEIPQIIFTTEYTREENTIIFHLRYEKRGLYIPLENYSDYKELQEQVDKELKKKIILQK
ncbi:MAG: transglutaminase domain-containing protein, partial [bacterium]